MKICVVGTGYVGLVTGTCFAETGAEVICMDVARSKIEALNRGEVPVFEPGLQEMVRRNLRQGRLCFTTDLGAAVRPSELIFIAVGTPPGQEGAPDLAAVRTVAREIAAQMNGYKIVVNKSTVPVGTARKLHQELKGLTDCPFDVLSNPEFLREGSAVEDFMKPDRVVIGADRREPAQQIRDLYSPLAKNGASVVVMDTASAEMTKYVANAMLAARISFINEMANLCERLGADIEQVRKAVGLDHRLGSDFLFPGIGYGGSCFPKDVRALLNMGEASGCPVRMVQAVHDVNEAQKLLLVKKILAHYRQDGRAESRPLEGKRFGVWGLAFKPQTDDLREAPSLAILDHLLEEGAAIQAYDPEAMEGARPLLGERIQLCPDNYSALQDVDALILVTEWNLFRQPDFMKMKALMKSPVVFDGRNLYDPGEMRELGFVYYGIGRL